MMLKFLGAIGGWQGYAAAAVLSALISIAATSYLVALPYRLTIANMKAEKAEGVAKSATEALSQFTTDAATIHSAAQSYAGTQIDLNTKLAAISKDFQHAISAKPLPADCTPSDDRVRALYSAIDAANSAIGQRPIPAVPNAH